MFLAQNQIPIDNSKPVEMIKDFVCWFADPDDIVMDFFPDRQLQLTL